jgi:hypothetical protein
MYTVDRNMQEEEDEDVWMHSRLIYVAMNQ